MSPAARGARSGHRIQTRVTILVAVGMLGPLAAIAWVSARSRSELEHQVLAEHTLLAALMSERLERLLSSGLEELHDVADPARTATTPGAARTALREAWVRRHSLFDAMFLVDREGHVLAQEPAPGAAAEGPRLLSEAERTGRAAFTDLLANRRAYAVVPIRTWDGDLAGAVGGAIDPGSPRLAAIFKGYVPTLGEWAEVIDGEGTVIASTDPSRLFSMSNARSIAQPWRGHLAAPLRELGGAPIAGIGADVEAERAGELVAFAPVSIARWGVSVRQPRREALAFSSDLSREVPLLSLVSLLVAVLFARGASRSMTKPLAALTAAAERLTAGELERPIAALQDDEVGRLGEALERMRQALKDSLERVERANQALEGRVAERTAELEGLNRELQARESSVRQLLAKVIRAQEDECRRIARELHDETTQSLAALIMRVHSALAFAAPGELRAGLEETAALATRTLDAVHRLIADLRPSILDDLGLKSAILWSAKTKLEPLGIAVRCEFAGLDGRLLPQLETVLFRVVQEAMTNVAKHAHASSVLIQASLNDGQLTLEVEDDGRGFEVAKPSSEGSGWGLLGMRERVEMLGGKLSVDSAPGQGTHVKLTLSLPREAPRPAALEIAHG